jgi:hypothetical protein
MRVWRHTQKVQIEFVVWKGKFVDLGQPKETVILERFLRVLHPEHRVVELLSCQCLGRLFEDEMKLCTFHFDWSHMVVYERGRDKC